MRPISTETVAIRALLDGAKGELTFTEAAPLLAAQTPPVVVTDVYFNAAKQGWRRLQEPVKPKAKPQIDQKLAIAFIVDNGGLAKVEADIANRQALVAAFKSILKAAA